MDQEELRDQILLNFADLTEVHTTGEDSLALRLPFHDTEGDPVELSVQFN